MKNLFSIPLSVLVCTMLLNACNSKSDNTVTIIKNGRNSVYEIHLKEIKDSVGMDLTDLAEDFEFVELESTENSIVERGKYLITREYILVQKPAHGILQFDRQGKFIRTLTKRGAGPNEYLRIGWTVDEDSQVLYMADVQKNNYLLRFNLHSGEYLGDLKKAIPINSSEVIMTRANTLLLIPSGAIDLGAEPSYFYEQDMQGVLLNTSSAPEDWLNRSVERTVLRFGDNIWFQNRKSDILNKVVKNQLLPYLTFDFGHKLPESGLEGDMSFSFDFEIGKQIFFHIFTVTGTTEWNGAFVSYGENTNYFFDSKEGKVSYHKLLFLNPTNHFVDAHERAFNVQSNGVLFYIYSAIDLLDQVEKAMEDEAFKEPYRSKLLKIAAKITENSNPVLLVGNILKHP